MAAGQGEPEVSGLRGIYPEIGRNGLGQRAEHCGLFRRLELSAYRMVAESQYFSDNFGRILD
jgi:hypothetical protein